MQAPFPRSVSYTHLDVYKRQLLDRMEIIEVTSYTENEKFHIAKNFLMKKQLERNGLTQEQVSITDGALQKVIHNYTREAGAVSYTHLSHRPEPL